MKSNLINVACGSVLFLLFACTTPSKKNIFLERVDIAEWNQLTMNLLIDSFRIDTTSFSELKQIPPVRYVGVYDYPNFTHTYNNDIAIAWNFLNRRYVLIQKLNEIGISHCSKIEIDEYYSLFDRKADYGITDGIDYYKVTVKAGKTTVEQRKEQSKTVRGFIDNRREELKPLRNLRIKSVIDFTGKKSRYTIQTIYIDDNR